MYELSKVVGYLLSPLAMALGLWLLAALGLTLRRRRWATALAALAFTVLWVGSMPATHRALTSALESQYPPRPVEAIPSADAIVVLGGALVPAEPPQRPYFGLGPDAGRIWHAARLYKAGKARWVVVAAGGEPGPNDVPLEAAAITEMLAALGVPISAIQLDNTSRTTRENAVHARQIVDRLNARRILLVTSAQHMPRAVKTFRKVWAHSPAEIIPVSADTQLIRQSGFNFLWIPSPNGLNGVTKALKEYAGLVALDIM